MAVRFSHRWLLLRTLPTAVRAAGLTEHDAPTVVGAGTSDLHWHRAIGRILFRRRFGII
jgi:hypothetical protein